jgi:hypothetical protein
MDSRKTERFAPVLLALAICFGPASASHGQNAPAPKTAASPSPAAKPNPNGTAAPQSPAPATDAPSASPSDTATSSALDYLFNRKAKDGSTAEKSTALAEAIGTKALADEALAGVSRTIDPEFESYLNGIEQSVELVEAYKTMLDETVQFLRDRKAYDAIANLYVLGRYNWDARISEQLANRVMALRDAKLSQAQLENDNVALEAKIKQANYNADQLSDRVQKQEADFQRRQSLQARKATAQEEQKGNANKNQNSAFLPNPEVSQQAVSSVMGRLQLSEEYFRSLDSRARSRLNEKEIEQIEAKTRKDFQQFIGVLYEGQRHHHARLAADFYRVLFGDGDLPSEMASQATAASEIITRIENDVETFKFKAEKGQMAGATAILQEAFSLSRNHPSLRLVNREEKLKVADYLADLQKLRNMIEARDFTTLESALLRLEEEVSDFDGTKPRSLVNAVKRESDMRLGMAKLAAQQGNLEKAMEEFKSAAQTWPDNPRLEEASNQFFESQDVMNQSNVEFDRAFAAEDFRLIFDQQLAFAVAVRGDAGREEQLKEALETVKAAELALEKAKLLERNRDPFGAWESVELAAEDWPEDPALNRRRADLAIRASDFVSAIAKAREAEQLGSDGYGLTWFLNAQSRYPASQLANEGIQRLTDILLGREVTKPEKEKEEAKIQDTPPEPKAEPETAAPVGEGDSV